jgi:FtsH-binding integral membrane protein
MSMIGYRTAVQAPGSTQQHLLVQRVSYLLASGLVVTAAGAYLFQDAYGLFLPIALVTFGLLFLLRAVARKPGVNVAVFYLFCLAEGAFLGPLLNTYAQRFGGGLVWEAFLLTAITVVGVGTYSYTSGRDFGFLGRALTWVLVAALIVGLASWFVVGLNTPIFVLGYESVIVVLFVGFLLYDFSNIRLRYGPEDYAWATVQVYLDFVNLFLAILRILSILQGGGGGSSRR